MTATLHSELDQNIVRFTLDNPGRKNALSMLLLKEISEAIPAASKAGARVAILTGANGVFSAGADLADIQGTAADAAYDRQLEMAAAAIQAFPGPVIAAISGPCIGAAVDLALACDIRICDADAFIEVPAVKLGLLYNPRSITRLHRKLPSQTLARMFLFGERFSPQKALEAGLVAHRFTSNDEMIIAVNNMVHAAAGVSPNAAALTKELLVALDCGDVDPANWEKLQLEILDSPDRRAAIANARERLGIDKADSYTDTKSTKTRGVK